MNIWVSFRDEQGNVLGEWSDVPIPLVGNKVSITSSFKHLEGRVLCIDYSYNIKYYSGCCSVNITLTEVKTI